MLSSIAPLKPLVSEAFRVEFSNTVDLKVRRIYAGRDGDGNSGVLREVRPFAAKFVCMQNQLAFGKEGKSDLCTLGLAGRRDRGDRANLLLDVVRQDLSEIGFGADREGTAANSE